jgi:hypothetical protein
MRGISVGMISSQWDGHLARHFGAGETLIVPKTIASRPKLGRNDISRERYPLSRSDEMPRAHSFFLTGSSIVGIIKRY